MLTSTWEGHPTRTEVVCQLLDVPHIDQGGAEEELCVVGFRPDVFEGGPRDKLAEGREEPVAGV
jgi:hypothetical protein